MIKIVDNFFNENDLKIIQNFALTKAFYTPAFFPNAPEKSQKYHYGNRYELKNSPELLDLFIKQAKLKFKIKIKEIEPNSGIDQRNLNHFKPHTDHDENVVMNLLIMISGPTAVTNGTVFYYGDMNNYELDTHIGFRENRAILFPSNIVHSQHASDVPNLKRYTATLFIRDYEEE